MTKGYHHCHEGFCFGLVLVCVQLHVYTHIEMDAVKLFSGLKDM